MVQNLKDYISRFYDWPFIIGGILALLIFGVIYTNNLQNVGPPNYAIESTQSLGIESGSALKDNILFAPHKIFGYLLLKLDISNAVSLRLVSVAAVLIALVLFFLLIKQWFSWRVAVLSTALLATSSWVLLVGRFAAHESMMLVTLPAFLYLGSLLKERKNDRLLPLLTFVSVSCLYVPGVWIIAIFGMAILAPNIRLAWRRQDRKGKTIWGLSGLIPLTPLVYGLLNVSTLKVWLIGWTSGAGLEAFQNNIRYLPSQLFVNGIPNSTLWLFKTPILDVATVVLAVIGAYYLLRDIRYPMRRITIVSLSVLVVILIGLFGVFYISLLLPLIYIFAAAGITFLLDQWFQIFPNNPFARSFGLILVSLLVLMICTYHVARYHYVWPRAESSRSVFKY